MDPNRAYRFSRCRSSADLAARLELHPGKAFNAIECADGTADAWGIMSFEAVGLAYLGIAWRDLGPDPALVKTGIQVFVATSEHITGFGRVRGGRQFSYRIPGLFRDFVEVRDDGLIFCDEAGFIGLSPGGDELWCHRVGGDSGDGVAAYRFDGERISGTTRSGLGFTFSVLESPNNTLPNQGHRAGPTGPNFIEKMWRRLFPVP